MATDLVVQIVGLANAMLSCCVRVDGLDDAVDIVGTDGDGADTVNISTGSTNLVVAASAKVAKVHHAFRRLDHRVQV
jgi:anthranilate phosphoribosyltransferase